MSAVARIRAIFFIHALSSGGLFSHIATIQQSLGVDEATLGLAFLGFPIGAILVFLFGSRVIETIGTRPVLMVSLPSLAVATALLTVMPNAYALFALFVAYGGIYALPNMAMNVEADRVEAGGKAWIMNSCHGVWSIGYLLATLLGTAANAVGLSPFMHLGLLAVPLVPIALWVTFGLRPSAPRPHFGQSPGRLALPTTAILLLVAYIIGPSLLEAALRNWSVIYMRDSFGAAPWVDTLTLPIFLAAQASGRMQADAAVRRFGPVRVARVLNFIALCGLGSVTLAPNLWVAFFGFMLIGVGVCVTYPLTTSAAARLGDRPASQNVASLTLATQVVLLGSPALLGFVASTFGIRMTFGIALPLVLASQWLARFLAPRAK